VDQESQELFRHLNVKIQSLSNWAEILDKISLETAYGLLLADRGQDSRQLWRQMLTELDEVRKISAKITSTGSVSAHTAVSR
jgi:hypothetical protein